MLFIYLYANYIASVSVKGKHFLLRKGANSIKAIVFVNNLL